MNLAFILCISLVCLGLAGAFISGWDDEDDDWGNERKATTAIQRFANKIRNTISTKASIGNFGRFRVITFKRRYARGTKYLLKIQIKDYGYIHVKAFRSRRGKVTYVKVKTGKKRWDRLEDF